MKCQCQDRYVPMTTGHPHTDCVAGFCPCLAWGDRCEACGKPVNWRSQDNNIRTQTGRRHRQCPTA